MKTIKGGNQPDLIRTNNNIREAVQMWLEDWIEAEEIFGKIEDWDTRQVTDMSHLFHSDGYQDDDSLSDGQGNYFNENISKWNVSNVTDMHDMFNEAHKFNQPLNKWDVSNVTDMSRMFEYAYNFNQPLDKWDVSNVKYMSGMFSKTSKFNQPLNKWDVSNVGDMNYMFFDAKSFNQPLDKWDVRSLNTEDMFAFAKSFNQDLTSWNVEDYDNFIEKDLMFEYAPMAKVNYPSRGIHERRRIGVDNKRRFNTLLSSARTHLKNNKDDSKSATREKALSVMKDKLKSEASQGEHPWYTKFGGKKKRKTKRRKSLKKKQRKTKRKVVNE